MATTDEQQIIEPGSEQAAAAVSQEPAAEPSPSSEQTSPSDMIEWFNSTIQQYDATFIVRGVSETLPPP